LLIRLRNCVKVLDEQVGKLTAVNAELQKSVSAYMSAADADDGDDDEELVKYEDVAMLVRQMFKAMPKGSKLRRSLLTALLDINAQLPSPVPQRKLAKALDLTTRTLRRAKADGAGGDGPAIHVLKLKQTLSLKGAPRPRLSEEQLRDIDQAWYACCEKKVIIYEDNNEDTTEYHLWLTHEAVYNAYVAAMMLKNADLLAEAEEQVRARAAAVAAAVAGGGEGGEPAVRPDGEGGTGDVYEHCNVLAASGRMVSRTTFMKYKPKDIQYGKSREAACPHCRNYAELSREVLKHIPVETHDDCVDRAACRRHQSCPAVKELEEKGLSVAARAALKALRDVQAERDEHRRIRMAQEKFVEDLLLTLPADTCCMGFDFSPIPGAYAPDRTLGEAMGKFQALMISVYFRVNNELKVRHFSYISPADNGHMFVRRTMLHLFSSDFMRQFRHVHMVSDGGPKHFKTRATIFFITVQLPRKFKLSSLTYHFWLSNHGKWVYDAMAAVLKRQIHILARAERRIVAGAAAFATVASTIRNMTGQTFEHVDESETFAVAGLEDASIRSQHAFRCLDFAAVGDGDNHVFVLEFKTCSTDDWSQASSARVIPAFPIDAGLDWTALDVEEPTAGSAVAAGRAAAEQQTKEALASIKAVRRADVWDNLKRGVRVAATFYVDGRKTEIRGTVLGVEQERRPHSETGRMQEHVRVRCDDEDDVWLGRWDDEWRVLDASEVADEAAEAEAATERKSRKGRTIKAPKK